MKLALILSFDRIKDTFIFLLRRCIFPSIDDGSSSCISYVISLMFVLAYVLYSA